jgi:hypothetical protein
LLNKISSLDFEAPCSDISPLWTKERYGISPEEATMAFDKDEDINFKILKKQKEYAEILENLKIDMSKSVLNTIKECRCLIQEAVQVEENASKSCRKMSAKHVSDFIRQNFPVNSWIEEMVEYVVAFSVNPEIDDEEAIIIGDAIDLLFNSITLEKSESFFSKFVYDACSWPVVVNRTFDENLNRLSAVR